jgi:hypothetical protein
MNTAVESSSPQNFLAAYAAHIDHAGLATRGVLPKPYVTTIVDDLVHRQQVVSELRHDQHILDGDTL